MVVEADTQGQRVGIEIHRRCIGGCDVFGGCEVERVGRRGVFSTSAPIQGGFDRVGSHVGRGTGTVDGVDKHYDGKPDGRQRAS